MNDELTFSDAAASTPAYMVQEPISIYFVFYNILTRMFAILAKHILKEVDCVAKSIHRSNAGPCSASTQYVV